MRAFLALTLGAGTFVALACGAFGSGSDESDPSPDAAPNLDAGVQPGDPADAIADSLPPSVQACTPDRAFEAPTVVKGLAMGALCFTLSPDETTAYFVDHGKAYSAPWSFENGVGYPSSAIAVTTGNIDVSCAAFTADRRFAFVELFFALTEQTRFEDGGYGAATVISPEGLAPGANFVTDPFVDRVTSQLYVSLIRNEGDAGFRALGIWHTPIYQDGTTRPLMLAAIPDDPEPYVPVLAGDSLSIYYSSKKGTDAGTPDPDIWVATRENAASPFTAGRRIDEVSKVAMADAPMYITNDGCHLFFRSGPVGPLALQTTYVAARKH